MRIINRMAGNTKLPIIVALIIGLAGGVLISNYTILGEQLDFRPGKAEKAEKKILYWVAPMDPGYRRDEPGKSPMGMDLVPVYSDEGADGDAVHISAAVEQSLSGVFGVR